MNDVHTPTPWFFKQGDDFILSRDGDAIAMTLSESEFEQHDAAFIVKAVNAHAQWAKWIVQRGPGLPDHACAECVPGGELVKAGFQCVYHEALAAAEGK